MIELLTSPEAWAALLTLTALEIVLGIDNVIFLSVIVSRIPPQQARLARQIGLALALVFRILLLSLLVWLIGLTQPLFTLSDVAFSWRDIILIGVWAVLAVVTLLYDFNVAMPVTLALCAIAVYVVASDAVFRLMRSAGA